MRSRPASQLCFIQLNAVICPCAGCYTAACRITPFIISLTNKEKFPVAVLVNTHILQRGGLAVKSPSTPDLYSPFAPTLNLQPSPILHSLFSPHMWSVPKRQLAQPTMQVLSSYNPGTIQASIGETLNFLESGIPYIGDNLSPLLGIEHH